MKVVKFESLETSSYIFPKYETIGGGKYFGITFCTDKDFESNLTSAGHWRS